MPRLVPLLRQYTSDLAVPSSEDHSSEDEMEIEDLISVTLSKEEDGEEVKQQKPEEEEEEDVGSIASSSYVSSSSKAGVEEGGKTLPHLQPKGASSSVVSRAGVMQLKARVSNVASFLYICM